MSNAPQPSNIKKPNGVKAQTSHPASRKRIAIIVMVAAVALLALVIFFALSKNQNSSITEESAATNLSESLDQAQSYTTGTWEETDLTTSRSCSLGFGASGVRSSANRFSDSTTNKEDVIGKVKSHWNELGYKVSERTDTTPAVIMRVFAKTEDGQELQFTAGDKGMTLSGLGTCVSKN